MQYVNWKLAGQLLPLFLALVAFGPSPARAGKPVVAVFDFKARRVRVHKETLVSLTDYLTVQLTGTGAYAVIPRGQLKKRLARQKVASYRACYDQSCQIEVGRELAAQKSLAPTLIKLGRRCIVTLTLYDLRRATTDRAASAEGGCREGDFTASVRRAVARLVGPLSSRGPIGRVRPPSPTGDRYKPKPGGDQCQPCRVGQRRCVGRGSYMACRPKGGRFLGCNIWSPPRRCPAGQPCKAGKCLGPHSPPPPARAAPPPRVRGAGIVVKGGRIHLGQEIYFAPRTATILKQSYPVLDKLARLLTTQHAGGKVRIEAHTDSRGSGGYNRRQTQARADAVRTYLIGKGVAAGRLLARGLGEERPIADNMTAQGRRRNRRIELYLSR